MKVLAEWFGSCSYQDFTVVGFTLKERKCTSCSTVKNLLPLISFDQSSLIICEHSNLEWWQFQLN